MPKTKSLKKSGVTSEEIQQAATHKRLNDHQPIVELAIKLNATNNLDAAKKKLALNLV